MCTYIVYVCVFVCIYIYLVQYNNKPLFFVSAQDLSDPGDPSWACSHLLVSWAHLALACVGGWASSCGSGHCRSSDVPQRRDAAACTTWSLLQAWVSHFQTQMSSLPLCINSNTLCKPPSLHLVPCAEITCLPSHLLCETEIPENWGSVFIASYYLPVSGTSIYSISIQGTCTEQNHVTQL